MERAASLKQGFIRFFVIACMLAVSVSFVFVLIRWSVTSTGLAIIAGLVLFFCLFFIQRQFSILRELKLLKNRVLDLSNGGTDPSISIGPLNEHVEREAILNFNARQQIELHTTRISNLEEQIQTLESNRERPGESNRQRPDIPSILPLASMEPFHEAVEDTVPVPAKAKTKFSGKSALKAALKGDNLNMHLQPIVELPSRAPVFFDAFMRLQTGEKEYLENSEFYKLADEGGLLPVIDSKILSSSTRILSTLSGLKKQAGLFCGISGKTFSDAKAFAEILKLLKANKPQRQSLIIGITQRHFIAMKPKELSRLKEISGLGFALSLDQTADLNLDLKKLAALGFGYVKIPASIILHADIDEDNSNIHPTELAAALKEHEMQLISTGIEQEDQVMNLIDYHVSLGQGLLFAPPRAVKTELMEASSK